MVSVSSTPQCSTLSTVKVLLFTSVSPCQPNSKIKLVSFKAAVINQGKR